MINRFICLHNETIKFQSALCQSVMNHLSVKLYLPDNGTRFIHIHLLLLYVLDAIPAITCYNYDERRVWILSFLTMHSAANDIVNWLYE